MKFLYCCLLALALGACTKEKIEPAKTTEAPEDIRVMVYATNGADTTPVASTIILRLNLK